MLPTDTVYGLACRAGSETAAADLYRLKGRDVIQPTAVIFAGLDGLLEGLPELAVRPRRLRGCSCPARTRSSSRTRRVGSRG